MPVAYRQKNTSFRDEEQILKDQETLQRKLSRGGGWMLFKQAYQLHRNGVRPLDITKQLKPQQFMNTNYWTGQNIGFDLYQVGRMHKRLSAEIYEFLKDYAKNSSAEADNLAYIAYCLSNGIKPQPLPITWQTGGFVDDSEGSGRRFHSYIAIRLAIICRF